MLPYANFLSNGKSVSHGTNGVDTTGYFRAYILLSTRHSYDIVWIYVDIPDCCKYVWIFMNNACKYVTTIFDDSTHALNVSFYIMRVILFCHLIGVNCRLYMSPDWILNVKNVLVYLDVIGKNIIHMIR